MGSFMAMINRPKFYASVRVDFGKLKQSQVDGFEYVLSQWEESGLEDLRWLAYILATTWHETAATVQPVREYGSDAYFVRRYWDNVKVRNQLGNVVKQDAIDFCGKGYVQITGRNNYTKMSKILYNDKRLLVDPNLALDAKVAANIMFEGMTTGKSFAGDFTGKHLGNYFNKTTNDPINARRIINGTDAAEKIKDYHVDFLKAIAV